VSDCITHPVDSDKVHGIKGFQIEGLVISIEMDFFNFLLIGINLSHSW
jgi:hypothetical protein